MLHSYICMQRCGQEIDNEQSRKLGNWLGKRLYGNYRLGDGTMVIQRCCWTKSHLHKVSDCVAVLALWFRFLLPALALAVSKVLELYKGLDIPCMQATNSALRLFQSVCAVVAWRYATDAYRCAVNVALNEGTEFQRRTSPPQKQRKAMARG